MILMKDIIKEDNPLLTTKSKDVKLPLSATDLQLANDLMEYVKNSQDDVLAELYELRPGVGLAAIQIGVAKRMFAVHSYDFDSTLYSYIVINPVINKVSKEITYIPGGEGCLSIDRDTSGLTPRFYSLEFSAHLLDPETQTVTPVTKVISGYPAIVFQHEYDHLEGILFTSKLYDTLPQALPLWTEDE